MHFLITAGGSREYIDPVRFISNASSGKMGYALVEAALKVGHDVTLVSSSYMQPPVGIDFIGVESAADMFTAVKKTFSDCDCLIMAAAVSDYTPKRLRNTKIKKTSKELIIIEGGTHTYGARHPMESMPEKLQTVFDLTENWFDRYLR